jgi:hypothetical protein
MRMASLREWIKRFWGTLRANRDDRDLEEELRLHLELAAEDALRRGHTTERAPRAARIHAGGVAQAMEALRDQRGLPWLDDLARDMRYGLRTLRSSPVFNASMPRTRPDATRRPMSAVIVPGPHPRSRTLVPVMRCGAR